MNAVTEFTIFIFFLLIIAWWIPRMQKDDSDHKTKKVYSGMIVYTDYGTGVQYVGTPLGGITPRLNADGSIRTINQVQE